MAMNPCIKCVKVNGETFAGNEIQNVHFSGIGTTIYFLPKSPDAIMGETIVTTGPVSVRYGEVMKEVEK